MSLSTTHILLTGSGGRLQPGLFIFKCTTIGAKCHRWRIAVFQAQFWRREREKVEGKSTDISQISRLKHLHASSCAARLLLVKLRSLADPPHEMEVPFPDDSSLLYFRTCLAFLLLQSWETRRSVTHSPFRPPWKKTRRKGGSGRGLS